MDPRTYTIMPNGDGSLSIKIDGGTDAGATLVHGFRSDNAAETWVRKSQEQCRPACVGMSKVQPLSRLQSDRHQSFVFRNLTMMRAAIVLAVLALAGGCT